MIKRSYLAFALVVLFSISAASAITASIGNSRMILYPEPGQSIDKYILVKNVNNVSVQIDLTVSGDLADGIKIKDNNFTLQPGDEKKAYFTVTPKVEGTTQTHILVRYTPPQGSGVGLTSTVIVVASKGNGTIAQNPNFVAIDDNSTENSTNSSSFSLSQHPQSSLSSQSGFSMSPLMFLTISTIILVIVFIVLVSFAFRRKKRVRGIK